MAARPPHCGLRSSQMAGAVDQKIEWSLGEAIVWIRTRDHDRVDELWDASEFEAVSRAFFDHDLLPRIEVPRIAPAVESPAGAAAASEEGSTKPSGQHGDTPERALASKDREEGL